MRPGALPKAPRARPHERALDLLFPPTCVGCRRPGRWVCETCWMEVPWRMGWFCPVCGEHVAASGCGHCPQAGDRADVIGTVADFDGVAREAIHTLKYHERHAIASLLGGLMAQVARDIPVDVITHVPLHRARRRERGYDQSALLARHVARALGQRPQMTLTRIRRTEQQALLARDARRENVRGAFRANTTWQGETFLLIDDVTTTGTTLGAAVEALRAAGAGPVIGLVFAHAL